MPIRQTNNTRNSNSTPNNQITPLAAGTVFNFTNATNRANGGLCMRLKDSKQGKGRFVNLETGKVLKATGGERATPTPLGTSITVA